MAFPERLHAAIRRCQNPTVMGLDPKVDYLDEVLRGEELRRFKTLYPASGNLLEDRLVYFNRRLIDATCDLIPAVKPQLAYYECLGMAGLAALVRTIQYAKRKGMMVILDGKRNDIGTTAKAYAEAYLVGGGPSDFAAVDALTVNAYLGWDGVKPFVNACAAEDKGIFILVRTSNPSAVDLQDLRLADGRFVYEAMADLIADWSEATVASDGYAPLGVVVGATWPSQMKELRRRLPHAVFLLPGYGAQGGGADDCVPAFRSDGTGAIVNASRSLICAYRKAGAPADFAEATRQEALRMRDDLQTALRRAGRRVPGAAS